MVGSSAARASSSATGLTPKSSMSAAGLWARISRAFSATHEPDPCCVSSTPSIWSAPSASRSEGLLTPKTAASSRSDGRRWPHAQAPTLICSMILRQTCS